MANQDYFDPRRALGMVAEPEGDEFEDEMSLNKLITQLEKRMRAAAKGLEFEEAAKLRDRIRELRRRQIYKG